MDVFDPIKSATEMGKQVRVSSVLNPILWALPFCLAAFIVVSFTNNIMAQKFLMIIKTKNMQKQAVY